MSHAEFVAGYRDGRVRTVVDRKGAARFVSARMMLPVFLLPVFGIAVALALGGFLIAGAVVFVVAIVFRASVRATSQRFVLSRARADPRFYREARVAGILRVEVVGAHEARE